MFRLIYRVIDTSESQLIAFDDRNNNKKCIMILLKVS